MRLTKCDALAGDAYQQFYFRDDYPMRPVEEETYAKGISRLKKAGELLLHRHSGKDERILVVSHGHAMSRLIEMLLGIDPVGRFDHMNTGMSLLIEGKARFTVRYANRMSCEDA